MIEPGTRPTGSGHPDTGGTSAMTNDEQPRHPITGARAIAVLPNGRIVWPISGGAPGEDDDDETGDKPGAGGKGGESDPAAEVAKWKAMAQKHEKMWKATGRKPEELKDLIAAAERLEAADEASRSEVEKAIRRAEKAEQALAEAEARALRLQIASEKGLTPAMARRLVGTTAAELEADADDLLKALAGSSGGAGGNGTGTADTADGKGGQDDKSRRPTEKLRPGAAPGAEPEDNDPTKLAGQIPRL